VKILYCHPGAELYGSDRMALQSAISLSEHGHEVVLVVPNLGPLTVEFERAGFRVEVARVPVLRKTSLKPRKLPGFVVACLTGLWFAARAIRRTKCDVVLVNTITQPVWVGVARALRVAVMCHIREAETEIPRHVARLLATGPSLADYVIFNSNHSEQVFREVAPFRPQGAVVYNGKPWDGYYASEPREWSNSVQLLLVGRISPRKGQDVALTALEELIRRGRDVELHLVGDVFPGYEWFRTQLVDHIDRAGLNSVVTFHGFESDVAGHLAASDIVLVPSRVEPFGTVALEAMAAKRPVVVSSVGGLAEIVAHGEFGAIVPPDNPTALANEIDRLIAKPDEAIRLAGLGFDRVRHEFSVERYGARLSSSVVAAVEARS
jgi:glycosyltransferase involved in cell wall biosynthesis